MRLVVTPERTGVSQDRFAEEGGPGHDPDEDRIIHRKPDKDQLANTVPLIAIWLSMLVVLGLIIVTAITVSDAALAGALVALIIATGAGVAGTLRLASAPPRDDQQDEDEAAGGAHSSAVR